MTDPMTLAEIRASIDTLDADLVGLLARREALVRLAAPHKRDTHDVRAPARVEQVIARAREHAGAAGADPDVVERVYRAMVQAYIDLELREHASTSADDQPAVS